MFSPSRYLLRTGISLVRGPIFVKSGICKHGRILPPIFSYSIEATQEIINDSCPRSVTLTKLEVRIKSNMLKKFKAAEITANLILPPEFQQTDALEPFLQHLVTQAGTIQFQINGAAINVDVNPPEVFAIKLRDKALVGLPFHPIKIEGSDSLNVDHCRFLWEYTKDRQVEGGSKKTSKKSIPKSKSEVWFPCGDKIIMHPDPALDGAFLRVTCTPSDGERVGTPITVELPQPVSILPVSKLLYEERLERLDPVPSDPNILRIVSYNILADTYTTPEWFCDSPLESLPYWYRMPILEKELESYNADIICLQEVEEKAFEGELQTFLFQTKKLEGTFSCKLGNTKEGVATFYNTQKLKLLQSETVELASALKFLPFWDSLKSMESVVNRLEERNTVLQLVVLENKNEVGSITLVAVTHLYFHPNADHIRLLQTMTCIRSIESKLLQLRQLYPDRVIRVFFAGDFNCTPPFSSFRLLTSGKVEATDDDWICYEPEKISPGIEFQHNLHLRNSHPGEELTNITLNFEGCLDYILYQPSHAELIKSYPPPEKATIGSISNCKDFKVSLPNLHCPSDHLPLIADFRLL
ncbi:unnamed protein product [Allacma fusca]|uniref:Endonuclease/exonuclease/phosphatase domain-containing protein n=1 Tax=Allacma fusca TaxID=39272 RepID=A0A8J2KA87_9HEXA|nr:unnamed protein product [Allacma fusca]